MDKKCPVVVNGRPCGLSIVRTGTLGELDVYECPKGHRTTFAARDTKCARGTVKLIPTPEQLAPKLPEKSKLAAEYEICGYNL